VEAGRVDKGERSSFQGFGNKSTSFIVLPRAAAGQKRGETLSGPGFRFEGSGVRTVQAGQNRQFPAPIWQSGRRYRQRTGPEPAIFRPQSAMDVETDIIAPAWTWVRRRQGGIRSYSAEIGMTGAVGWGRGKVLLAQDSGSRISRVRFRIPSVIAIERQNGRSRQSLYDKDARKRSVSRGVQTRAGLDSGRQWREGLAELERLAHAGSLVSMLSCGRRNAAWPMYHKSFQAPRPGTSWQSEAGFCARAVGSKASPI